MGALLAGHNILPCTTRGLPISTPLRGTAGLPVQWRMNARETSTEAWRDPVDRAAAHDIRYLIGGSDGEGRTSPYSGPEDAPLAPLLLDLAHAPEARLRNALTALFLRHPEDVATAEVTARELSTDDPARQLLLVSILVAAALQNEWSFAIGFYLPNQTRIEADHLAAELGLPSPAGDFGRPCLVAAAHLLRERDPFPFNYEAAWEDGAHRLLVQLAREARDHGT